jgi:hypothetical protein
MGSRIVEKNGIEIENCFRNPLGRRLWEGPGPIIEGTLLGNHVFCFLICRRIKTTKVTPERNEELDDKIKPIIEARKPDH